VRVYDGLHPGASHRLGVTGVGHISEPRRGGHAERKYYGEEKEWTIE